MEFEKHYWRVSPRFSETDMMKVIHHSRYWVWFEEARFAFIEDVLGITIDNLEKSQFFLPVIECNCKYIKRIKWGKELVIRTVLELQNSSYFTFHQTIFYADDLEFNNVLCKSYIKQAFVDESFTLKLHMPSFFEEAIKSSVIKTPAAFI
ncbi:acyl-CoA thioesterase [Sphingobacterium sp. HSC-15S19]|uniref:acyl-CoA thioesterase n=1 Tax=Sphingobacterium sp. HSC-15S19 TaxID=2910971 RepID=UPI003D23A6CC